MLPDLAGPRGEITSSLGLPRRSSNRRNFCGVSRQRRARARAAGRGRLVRAGASVQRAGRVGCRGAGASGRVAWAGRVGGSFWSCLALSGCLLGRAASVPRRPLRGRDRSLALKRIEVKDRDLAQAACRLARLSARGRHDAESLCIQSHFACTVSVANKSVIARVTEGSQGRRRMTLYAKSFCESQDPLAPEPRRWPQAPGTEAARDASLGSTVGRHVSFCKRAALGQPGDVMKPWAVSAGCGSSLAARPARWRGCAAADWSWAARRAQRQHRATNRAGARRRRHELERARRARGCGLVGRLRGSGARFAVGGERSVERATCRSDSH